MTRIKKVLYTASTDIHLINFHTPYLKWFQSQGYQVHVACGGSKEIEGVDVRFLVPFKRSPFDTGNYKAYKTLKNIIDKNDYDLVHCHTPTCGVITRLAARKARRLKTKVIYTAHGFHFYKGASLINWLLFFPIEIILAALTDAVITINNEDFQNLQKKIFNIKGKYKIDGIGINPSRLTLATLAKNELKKQLGIKEQDILFLYIAEFIPRKNHLLIFKSLSKIISQNSKVKILFAGGASSEQAKMKLLAQNAGFLERVVFLGYQNNIAQFINIADVGVSSSTAEGLPIGILEIMYMGKPVIASNIRGHNEIINDNQNGFLFKLDNPDKFISTVLELANNKYFRNQMGESAKLSTEKYMINKILLDMEKIYHLVLNNID
ncbi:MAG: glycosyltransferase family 4 protein [Cyclobacteriaceae bacterium]|nr:glycosyltransferase family 4 protein [Cyclobacteriaceae bacterium]